jgi:hypothetical protein
MKKNWSTQNRWRWPIYANFALAFSASGLADYIEIGERQVFCCIFSPFLPADATPVSVALPLPGR